MTVEVMHEPDASRFTLVEGDEVLGFTEYDRPPGGIRFLHTEIDPKYGGRGYGTQLITGALDWVRANTQLRVSASCPFTRKYLAEHPDEYRDLLERPPAL